jgi:hypothetical protein
MASPYHGIMAAGESESVLIQLSRDLLNYHCTKICNGITLLHLEILLLCVCTWISLYILMKTRTEWRCGKTYAHNFLIVNGNLSCFCMIYT